MVLETLCRLCANASYLRRPRLTADLLFITCPFSPDSSDLDSLRKSLSTHLLVEIRILGQAAHLEALPHAAQHLPALVPGLGYPPGALELPRGGAVGQQGGGHGEARPDDDAVAEAAGLGGVDERGDPPGDHVEEAGGRGEVADAVAHLVGRRHAFEEQDVGAGVAGEAEAGEGLVVAEGLEGVGAGDEDDVVAGRGAGGGGGADAGREGGRVDELLAQEVAAALGGGLVFYVEGGDAGLDVALDLFGEC